MRRLIWFGLMLCGCGSGDGPVAITPPADDVVSTILVADLDTGAWPTDALSVLDASIIGDTLRMDVQYAGGCEEHAFGLVVSTTFRETQPVQTTAILAHDNMGDTCEALISRLLKADLAPLKAEWQRAYQAPAGTIVIALEGAGSLSYSF